MLTGNNPPHDKIITTKDSPRYGAITIENIAVIGQALDLVLMNGSGGNSGPAGTRRAQATAAKYTCCFAENDEENPWAPFHVENGFGPDTSTVTIMAGKGTHLVHVVDGTKEILRAAVRALQGFTYHDIGVPWDQLFILSPDHAHRLAKAGWTKTSIRQYIHERARIPMAAAEPARIFLRFSESLLKEFADTKDRNMPIPITEKPEDLQIVVAGGTGNGTPTLVAGIRRHVTAEIDKYKPRNWQQLLDAAQVALVSGLPIGWDFCMCSTAAIITLLILPSIRSAGG